MKQKLLLTSQGIPKKLKDVFLSLLSKPPRETKVSFVTTAAYGEEDNPIWLEVYRKQLRSYGIKDIKDLDLRYKSKKELKKILGNIDIVFVNGGNTFYLLKYVRESGFDDEIKDFINRGGLYVGVSAGSYIACPTIEQSFWKQRFPDRKTYGVKDLAGLNFVPFWIIAHFEEKWRPDIEKAAKTTKYPVIALTNTQGVLVENEKWKIVEKGEKVTFNFDKIP